MKPTQRQKTNSYFKLFMGIVVLTIGIVLFYFFSRDSYKEPAIENVEESPGNPMLIIEDKVLVPVEIADTPEKTTLGLSYRPSLPENEGMLFKFRAPHIPTFWMFEMNFPLDMIWIGENGTIVDITENVPHPSPGTPDRELPRYSPKLPAKMILEVNAGFSKVHGIEVGDRIELADF